MKFEESEILELKKTTSELKEAVISIASILNKHQTGEIYFGVKNDGTIVGQTVSDKTLRDISKAVSDNIEPKIYPEIQNISLSRKQFLVKLQTYFSQLLKERGWMPFPLKINISLPTT